RVVDVGVRTAEAAVISLGGIVSSTSIRIAGDAFDHAIVQHVKNHFSLAIGERTAEELKIAIGSASPLVEEIDVEVRGRDLVSGLPRTIQIESEDVRVALEEPVSKMIQAIKNTLDNTPPDLASDLMEYGILLTGGGGLLRGLDERLRQETGIPVHVSPTALTNVVLGCARVLESPDYLSQAGTTR
ncbi:MAG: rod shape-determining protein, partial [Coriobacteriales bacterium]|nr:rod shape-determining protein [Coriobacteriales bacterium]